jgi:hypothetical protein
MARRFTNASLVKSFLVAGLLAFAGPALAAPGAQGPNAHSQAKPGKSTKAPTVVVATPAPKAKAKAKQVGKVAVVVAPKVVVRGEPRVTVSYGPQVVVAASRPVQERPSLALRSRLEQAQASGRLNRAELRRLQVALQQVEAAERRFFRDDRRLDRSELRTLARLEASFDQSFQQAMRGRGRA